MSDLAKYSLTRSSRCLSATAELLVLSSSSSSSSIVVWYYLPWSKLCNNYCMVIDNIKYWRSFYLFSDDASSVVKSYLTEDGLWSATIRTTAELYVVEVFHFNHLIWGISLYGLVQHARIFSFWRCLFAESADSADRRQTDRQTDRQTSRWNLQSMNAKKKL